MWTTGNPENEELYTDVDRFHMQQDKIKFGGGVGDSGDSDDSVRFSVTAFFFFSLVSPLIRVFPHSAVVDSHNTHARTH